MLKSLKSFFVYKFVCPGWNACYIGETTHHLSTRIKEHLEWTKSPTFLNILLTMKLARHLVLRNCFEIIDSASMLNLKEAMHTIWKKPSLNKKQKHVSISITVQSSFIFNYYFHFTLSFPFILSSVLLSF